MSDGSPRAWRFYIDDMIGFAEKIATSYVPALLENLRSLKNEIE